MTNNFELLFWRKCNILTLQKNQTYSWRVISQQTKSMFPINLDILHTRTNPQRNPVIYVVFIKAVSGRQRRPLRSFGEWAICARGRWTVDNCTVNIWLHVRLLLHQTNPWKQTIQLVCAKTERICQKLGQSFWLSYFRYQTLRLPHKRALKWRQITCYWVWKWNFWLLICKMLHILTWFFCTSF